MSIALFVFFFQAEDGIRDSSVTGVQTCALPISLEGFGRTSKSHEYLTKPSRGADPGPDEPCACGSGRAFRDCCLNLKPEDRMRWDVYSIRERNLMFMRAIEKVLGLNEEGKTWDDVRTDLSDEQVRDIHLAYASLWPQETNIAELLPRPDPRVFRAVYM